jgi:hypothetical protein
MMNYEEIKDTITEWEFMLSARMKKYIHYRTMRNFVLHVEDIKNEQDRARILQSERPFKKPSLRPHNYRCLVVVSCLSANM